MALSIGLRSAAPREPHERKSIDFILSFLESDATCDNSNNGDELPDTLGVVQVNFYTISMTFLQVTQDVAKTMTQREIKGKGQNQVR